MLTATRRVHAVDTSSSSALLSLRRTRAPAIYLMGGWNGIQNLADLWRFDLPSRSATRHGTPRRAGGWTLISRDTREQGGPGQRSCHKACLDEQTGDIYVVGRFVDLPGGDVRLAGGGF